MGFLQDEEIRIETGVGVFAAQQSLPGHMTCGKVFFHNSLCTRQPNTLIEC